MNLQTFTAEGLNDFRQQELRAAAKKVNANRVGVNGSGHRGSIVARLTSIVGGRSSTRTQPVREVATSASR